ncbi:WGR domain-containing protein [Tropicimonas sp. TH_r6]|uniref:WGR domain-containing protein n=1 Tax=Tropicimonas sp. TH_r6 TaxID=3082085 RepID=UPI003985C561
MEIVRGLFGDWGLVRNWGRVGGAGQLRTDWFGSESEAKVARFDLHMQKAKRATSSRGTDVCLLRNLAVAASAPYRKCSNRSGSSLSPTPDVPGSRGERRVRAQFLKCCTVNGRQLRAGSRLSKVTSNSRKRTFTPKAKYVFSYHRSLLHSCCSARFNG